MSAPSANTIVECPSEKKKPTPSGRCPSLISLRVVLSIARDVVGVERVAQAERVGGDADADAEHAARAERVPCGTTSTSRMKKPTA